MKFFITGITGFAGTHLTKYLLKKNCEVTGIYYPANSENLYKTLFPDIDITECNLLDETKLNNILNKIKPDIIIHLAAISSVKYSLENPEETFNINFKGSINLINTILKNKLDSKLLFVSSADVYGNVDEKFIPIIETQPVNPTSPYSISKYSIEQMLSFYKEQFNLKYLIVRPFNHIGIYQKESFVISAFAKQLAQIKKNNKKPILEIGNLNVYRDFTDVQDVVEAYYKLSINENCLYDIFNISSNKKYSLKIILDKLLKIADLENIEIKVLPELFRKIDLKILQGDNSKIKSFIDWNPKISIDDSLTNIYNYFLK